MAFLDVGDGAAAFLDGGKEVEHVPASGRRGVEFYVLLSDILGILLPLIHAFEVDRLGVFIHRDEVGSHGAGLERAFLAVDEKRPGVIGVGRRAPSAVLPYRIEAVVFKGSRLGVRNVPLAILL